jgi:geranylgeranyl transferase type-1 subunit beta
MNEPGLKPLDSALCISEKQKQLIGEMQRSLLVPVRRYWKHGFCFSIREDDPDFDVKMKDSEGPPKDAKEKLDLVA